ncbi:MAG TPA: sulfatase [Opitutae bacterium]|nr:sulfatase [Opitutae bacterium]
MIRVLCISCLCLFCLMVPAATQPNILFIVADDLGIGDTGFSGGKDFPTPFIDRIAKEGAIFTSAYLTSPVCSPSRAGMLSGRYQQRFGHEMNPSEGAVEQEGLPLSEKLLPARLLAAGYHTGIVGKWHLGTEEAYRPLKRGFAEQPLGFLGGSRSYTGNGKGIGKGLLTDDKPVELNGYLTDAFGDAAVGFINRNKGKPWFLYAAFNAAHGPLQPNETVMARVSESLKGDRRKFAGLMLSLDDNVGKMLAALKASGQDENTLIVFISDNGGQTLVGASNLNLRGHKGMPWEGGIRTPMAVRWPSKINAGTTCTSPTITLDISATFMQIATGAVPKDFDGRSFLGAITNAEKLDDNRPIHWRFGAQWATRVGDWKIVRAKAGKEAELYNLAQDPTEKTNLAPTQAEKLKEVQAIHAAWDKTLIAPLWVGNPGQVKEESAKTKAKK